MTVEARHLIVVGSFGCFSGGFDCRSTVDGGQAAAGQLAQKTGKNYDEFKRMVYDADASEYFVTNDSKEFAGNALELMVALYKAEQLPVKIRLYAASKAVEFEPRILPQLQTDAEREQETEAIWALIEQRQQFAIDETLHQLGRGRSSGAPAVIVEQVAERLRTAAQRETHISEISLPAPPRPVVRKREPVRIDE